MSLATVIRALLVFALATHVFFMYSFARAEAGTVGLDPVTSARALVFAMILMLPFVWALGIADLPDLYQKHIRPTRRWKRSACPACGYDMRGHAAESPAPSQRVDMAGPTQGPGRGLCPECGSPMLAPPPYRYSWATVRRFLMLVFLALVVGSTLAEASMLTDERQFEYEVNQWQESGGEPTEYRRPRRWPNGSETLRGGRALTYRTSD